MKTLVYCKLLVLQQLLTYSKLIKLNAVDSNQRYFCVLETFNKPGHAWVLQLISNVVGPKQNPGLKQLLTSVVTPPPQEAEQLLTGIHELNTEKKHVASI